MNERTKINIEVLQQLQSGELTKQGAAKYTGWGGMRHDMENPDVQQQLKTLMTPNEIKSALNSITSAYYTPLPIVQFIYQALDKMGACYGRLLEPAAGAGVFLDGAIERGAKEMVTVELDSISAKLLRCGYPTVTHKQGGFETFTR